MVDTGDHDEEMTPASHPAQATSSRSTGEGGGGGATQLTSSYDALMRLTNLDDCIQDALATREKLEVQMNRIIENNRSSMDTMIHRSQAREDLAKVRGASAAAKKQLRQTQTRRDEILHHLATRRQAMDTGRNNQERTKAYIREAQALTKVREEEFAKHTENTMVHIRRIAENLSRIFPIESIPGRTLSFTICGLSLPNSALKYKNKEVIAAAFGHSAHLTYLLSCYISVPLPYTISPFESHSYVEDNISMGLVTRTFPLYPVVPQYRFEYGIFLLNKDIEHLMNRLGLRVADLRQTLPNLKILLSVLSSSTRELPLYRRTGTTLLRVESYGSGQLTPSLSSVGGSRRGSEGNDSSRSVGARSADGALHSRRWQDQMLKSRGTTQSLPVGSSSSSNRRRRPT